MKKLIGWAASAVAVKDGEFATTLAIYGGDITEEDAKDWVAGGLLRKHPGYELAFVQAASIELHK